MPNPYAEAGTPDHPDYEGDWWKLPDDPPVLDVTDVAVAVDGEPVPAAAAYTLDSVPTGARDVKAWIEAAETDEDAEARATAALEVEREGHDPLRATVVGAVSAVLGGDLIG